MYAQTSGFSIHLWSSIFALPRSSSGPNSSTAPIIFGLTALSSSRALHLFPNRNVIATRVKLGRASDGSGRRSMSTWRSGATMDLIDEMSSVKPRLRIVHSLTKALLRMRSGLIIGIRRSTRLAMLRPLGSKYCCSAILISPSSSVWVVQGLSREEICVLVWWSFRNSLQRRGYVSGIHTIEVPRRLTTLPCVGTAR